MNIGLTVYAPAETQEQTMTTRLFCFMSIVGPAVPPGGCIVVTHKKLSLPTKGPAHRGYPQHHHPIMHKTPRLLSVGKLSDSLQRQLCTPAAVKQLCLLPVAHD